MKTQNIDPQMRKFTHQPHPIIIHNRLLADGMMTSLHACSLILVQWYSFYLPTEGGGRLFSPASVCR